VRVDFIHLNKISYAAPGIIVRIKGHGMFAGDISPSTLIYFSPHIRQVLYFYRMNRVLAIQAHVVKKVFFFSLVFLLSSCNFPYQPKQFVLPEIQSSFISGDSLQAFAGTLNVKIAFTLNEGSRFVYFVDFNQPAPVAVKLKKPAGKESLSGDSPLISPDGLFVSYFLTHGADIQGAYFQKLNSTAEPVLVSANGTEPHWWKDSLGQTYIIYSDQLLSSALVSGANFTYRQKVSLDGNASLTGPAERIAPYAMNGGMSANGRFLCTGYKNAAFYDMSDSLLHPINEGVQTCNPSIDPDTSQMGIMMFLNIGGKQNLKNFDFPSPLVDEHSMLFIVNTENSLIDYVPLSLAKAKYYPYTEWQDPEWSNIPRFAVALGVINDANADLIIIKGIADKSAAKEILNVTPGKFKLNATSTPCLWIGK
jgi:hypothetical protein